MDDAMFLITASDGFGTFTWEYPEDVKEVLRALAEQSSEEAVLEIIHQQRQMVGVFLFMLTGTLHAGTRASQLAMNIHRHLSELAGESLRLLGQ